MTDKLLRIVSCPNCRKPTQWSEANRFRPFCSERCRLIDLGAWASDDYRIPIEDEPGMSTDEREDQD